MDGNLDNTRSRGTRRPARRALGRLSLAIITLSVVAAAVLGGASPAMARTILVLPRVGGPTTTFSFHYAARPTDGTFDLVGLSGPVGSRCDAGAYSSLFGDQSDVQVGGGNGADTIVGLRPGRAPTAVGALEFLEPMQVVEPDYLFRPLQTWCPGRYAGKLYYVDDNNLTRYVYGSIGFTVASRDPAALDGLAARRGAAEDLAAKARAGDAAVLIEACIEGNQSDFSDYFDFLAPPSNGTADPRRCRPTVLRHLLRRDAGIPVPTFGSDAGQVQLTAPTSRSFTIRSHSVSGANFIVDGHVRVQGHTTYGPFTDVTTLHRCTSPRPAIQSCLAGRW